MSVKKEERPRFVTPVETSRPRMSHQYEVASPKLGRRLRLFDRMVLDQWILLEADPAVTTFCERPTYLESDDGAVLVDFWVQRRRREEFLIITRASGFKRRPRADGRGSRKVEAKVRSVKVADIVAHANWISNWRRMLPFLIAYRCWVDERLMGDVVSLCGRETTLCEIEQELAPLDPMLVRTAVFQGLAEGTLRAPALHSAPLGLQTVLSKTRRPRDATHRDRH